MNKNYLQQKQLSYLAALSPAASSEMNHSPFTTHHSHKRKPAFTLAEVLITLGIIGIVAALTIPTIIANYKKQVTINKLKKAYTELSQVAQRGVNDCPVEIISETKVDAKVTKDFFDNYWLKYFKGVEIYNERFVLNDGTHFYKNYDGSLGGTNIYTEYARGRIFFSTADKMTYYVNIMHWINVKYNDEGKVIAQDAVYSSSQFVYVDVNGINPPNTVGKDVFGFVVSFSDGVVRPDGYGNNQYSINKNCTRSGNFCVAKIMQDAWKINYWNK